LDKSLITFIIFISFALPSFALELGNEFLTAKSYTDQFRQLLLNKIKQMDQNFIRNIEDGSITYISRSDELCLDNTLVTKNIPLMRIILTQSLEDGVYQETRSYTGCNGKVVFQENIVAKGLSAPMHTMDDFHKNNMDFSKVREYSAFEYSFLDEDGGRTYAVVSRTDNDIQEMNFILNNQVFMQRVIQDTNWISYTSFPLDFEMSRNGYRFRTSSTKRFDNQLRAKINKNNVEYYNSKGERIALATFQKNFTVNGADLIMDSFFAYYPKTSFVTSNLQSSKMLTELRDAETFLINGVNLELVRILVRDYIEAIERGEIVDNRK
jgi:hypothetical protein